MPQGATGTTTEKGGRHRKRMRRVSVWMVNILPQMRRTFDPAEQRELSESIAEKGVINAPTVAFFSRHHLEEYLAILNRLWNRTLVPADLRPSRVRGQSRWLVLLAGERRVRSYREGVKRRVLPRKLQVVLHENIDPFDAVDIQITENSHRRVPPFEEAHAIAKYWVLTERRRGAPPKITHFARRIGRSPEVVRAALQFVELPTIVQDAVAGRWGSEIQSAKYFRAERLRLPYGIAIGLARLLEARKREGAGVSPERLERELVARMTGAVLAATKVDDFLKMIAREVGNGGQTLLDLMSAEAEEEHRRLFRKRTVEAGVHRTLQAQELWFRKVLELYHAKLLGQTDSPFSDRSVRRRLVAVAELYEQVFALSYRRPSQKTLARLGIVSSLKHQGTEPKASAA